MLFSLYRTFKVRLEEPLLVFCAQKVPCFLGEGGETSFLSDFLDQNLVLFFTAALQYSV